MLQGKYPLLIALVLGLLAGVIAYSAIKSQEAAVREGWNVTQILCAASDLDEGTEIEEGMIAACRIPSQFITDSFITIPEGEDLLAMMPYGQRILVPLKEGDPVLYSHFESQRVFNLSENIPTKARAIAIGVDERGSVNQWIRPNDHVDIIGTFRDGEGREMIAVTLLENIIVLATGHQSGMSTYVSEEDRRYTHVVLLVGSEEAEILALASESGTLTLALRNPRDLDVGTDRTTKTDHQTLITGERTKVLREVRTKTWQQIDVIEGRQRSTTTTSAGQ